MAESWSEFFKPPPRKPRRSRRSGRRGERRHGPAEQGRPDADASEAGGGREANSGGSAGEGDIAGGSEALSDAAASGSEALSDVAASGSDAEQDARAAGSEAGASPRADRTEADPRGQADGTATGRAALTVTGLLGQVRRALGGAFPDRVAVAGEISNFKRAGSGHLYFCLKDDRSAMDAVMFRLDADRLKFTLADGLEVLVEGRVDVYPSRGQLQLYVEAMTPKGEGALELAFRQLKEKLAAEGLFDPAAKRPLPALPSAVGVVTASTGAAIHDIARTVARRWPAAKLYLLPSRVQGEGAAEEIARAVADLDAAAERLGIGVIIVGRGGGSLEDLWAFNEEAVARAVYAARTPIVSAVGHEVDVSICDLVADRRAATPTAAAEVVVPDGVEMRRGVAELARRMIRASSDRLAGARAGLEGVLRSVVFRDPAWRLGAAQQRLDEWAGRLHRGVAELLGRKHRRFEPLAGRLAGLHPARLAEQALGRLEKLTGRLAWALGNRAKRAGDALAAVYARLAGVHPAGKLKLLRQQVRAAERQLEAMSYRSVLRRGYSVTRDESGRILRSAGQVAAGDRIETELAEGQIAARVTGTGQTAPADSPPFAAPAPAQPPIAGRRRGKTAKNRPPGGPGLFNGTETTRSTKELSDE